MRKELEKGRLRGPEGNKGAKGGLFINHYELLAIRMFLYCSLSIKTNKSGIILFNIGLHCNLTSFNIV